MRIKNNGTEKNLDGKISKFYNRWKHSRLFCNSFSAPCRHIFMIRKYNKPHIFSKTCFHARYIILIENSLSMDTDDYVNEDIDDHFEDETFIDDFDCLDTIFSDREKFITALVITQNIADILSNHGTQTFNKYVEKLKEIKRNAKNGIYLFEHDGSALSAIEPEESEE